MNLTCNRCGEEKPGNQFYYHRGDKRYMQPCKVCWNKRKSQNYNTERRKAWNAGKAEFSKGVSIKELSNYLLLLNELADWGRDLVFTRKSGFVPESKKFEKEYRFRRGEDGLWEVGCFKPNGDWKVVNRYEKMVDAQCEVWDLMS